MSIIRFIFFFSLTFHLYSQSTDEIIYTIGINDTTLIAVNCYVDVMNTNDNWSAIETIELWNSTEGGEAKYYIQNDSLKKIVAQYYGETFRKTEEYFIQNNVVVCILETEYEYNRPITWDSTTMQENHDDQTFDFEKSDISITKNYFLNGDLIRQISNQDCNAPFSKEYLEIEQKRLIANFTNLANQLDK